MDEKDMITGLTEVYIRQLAGEQSFERGMNYYLNGAIREPMRQGTHLWGKCEGSQDEPYSVGVVLGESGITQAYCSCPRGGFCKHIVALLLTYIHEPEIFLDIDSLKAGLASLSKEVLVALIMKMIQREPSMLGLVEGAVAMPSGGPLEIDTVRRRVRRALRYDDPDYIVIELRDILQIIDKLAEKGEWKGAGIVYREVLDGLVTSYEDDLYGIDYEGIIASFANECVEGLWECLEKGIIDNETRRDWLATLLDAELVDIRLGGVDFAYEAFDVILSHANEEEWALLEERVRELIEKNDGWEREKLVNVLVAWREKYGRPDKARSIIRELGTVEQRMFLLVQEGKAGEAVAVAKEHFVKKPGIILNLARVLDDAGEGVYGAELLTQLAKTEDSHPDYLEWLAEYYRKNSNLDAALKWSWHFSSKARQLNRTQLYMRQAKNLALGKKCAQGYLKNWKIKITSVSLLRSPCMKETSGGRWSFYLAFMAMVGVIIGEKWPGRLKRNSPWMP
ncbi:SWIM zinc finger family protein [Moorella sulfitireducens]|uniref:SWIM zinc finger family protein n=1 Tax=Neomoorella sulfitireducens TaxID=2972948 RepID=UPI0021AD3FB8|nr:SWIM zinc finger family protein [Moorella sulfitireducens]